MVHFYNIISVAFIDLDKFPILLLKFFRIFIILFKYIECAIDIRGFWVGYDFRFRFEETLYTLGELLFPELFFRYSLKLRRGVIILLNCFLYVIERFLGRLKSFLGCLMTCKWSLCGEKTVIFWGWLASPFIIVESLGDSEWVI